MDVVGSIVHFNSCVTCASSEHRVPTAGCMLPADDQGDDKGEVRGEIRLQSELHALAPSCLMTFIPATCTSAKLLSQCVKSSPFQPLISPNSIVHVKVPRMRRIKVLIGAHIAPCSLRPSYRAVGPCTTLFASPQPESGMCKSLEVWNFLSPLQGVLEV